MVDGGGIECVGGGTLLLSLFLVGGPARKMTFFQMAPKLFLSDQTHSNRCEYVLYEVWFNKIDHIHTYVAAKVIMFFH